MLEACRSAPMPPTAPADTLADQAIELARRWVTESAEVEVDPAAERLAGVLKDPNGLPFTIGFVDGVMRPESLDGRGIQSAAASRRSCPSSCPGTCAAPCRSAAPSRPCCRRPSCRSRGGCCARWSGTSSSTHGPRSSGPAIAKIRESGAKLNLNLLGEAVLGEQEALRRLDGIHELIRRPDVDYVSVKVSAIASHISMWAFDDVVDKVVERLMPLYLHRRA